MIRPLYKILLAVLIGAALAVPATAANRNFAGKSSLASDTPGNAAQEWLGYYDGSREVTFSRISYFMSAHPDFPARDKLRTLAEMAMPGDLSDAETLVWFSVNPPQTTFGMKMYAQALNDAHQQTKARKEINDWWKRAYLTKVEQQDGYNAFRSVLDRSSSQQRLSMLIYKEQYTNARALAAMMGNGYPALTEARISLRTGNGNPNGYLSAVPVALRGDEGLLFDRLQYRRKDDNDDGAIEILNQSPPSGKMYNSESWGKERGIIARRLFEEGKYSQAYTLSANHNIKDGPGFAQNEWMAGWLALEYLNKPWEAFEHFERLYHHVETPISRSRAAYWAGLASEHLQHPEVAAKWYDAGAKYKTTFYGQLCGQKMQRSGDIPSSGVTGNPKFKNGDMAQAARWLQSHGHRPEAAMFLARMIDEAKTPQDYAAVAEVSNAISMRNMAIKAAQESEKKTGVVLLNYSFPKIEKYLTDVDFVEWALVHALVRQESRYDDQAVSAAGARGLMQLMPRTASEVADKAGMAHRASWLTERPSHNIALGSLYLKKLLDRYDGNYAMALAAYNAGPARVDQWTQEIGDPRNPKVDLVNWIEMIPIYETRNYVQRVLEGVEVYRHILHVNKGGPQGDIHLAAKSTQ